MKIEMKVITNITLEGNDELFAMRDICELALTKLLDANKEKHMNVKDGSWDDNFIERTNRNIVLVRQILEEIR